MHQGGDRDDIQPHQPVYLQGECRNSSAQAVDRTDAEQQVGEHCKKEQCRLVPADRAWFAGYIEECQQHQRHQQTEYVEQRKHPPGQIGDFPTGTGILTQPRGHRYAVATG